MRSDKIKNYTIGGLLCVVVMLAIGIQPVQRMMNKVVMRGTVNGADNCINYVSGKLVSEDAVKASCISSLQKRLRGRDYATGKAGPSFVLDNVSWRGFLQNKSRSHVTTWVKIVVIIYDVDGVRQETFVETPMWIEPSGEERFNLELPDIKAEQIKALDFCDFEAIAPKDCIDWGVVEVKGLSI